MKSLLHWIWKTLVILLGIAIGWSSVAVFTEGSTPFLPVLLISIGIVGAAIHKRLKKLS